MKLLSSLTANRNHPGQFPVKALLLGASLPGTVAAPSAQAQNKAEKPNVIVIFMDDMGYADVGSFGATGYQTPNLDRMAKAGRRFTNFHVAQPVCTASRAALLTGCYPSRISVQGAWGPNSQVGINNSEVMLPQMFKAQGYATGMVGKWHLGDAPQFLPTSKGFDEWFGIPYSHDMWPYHPETPAAYPPLPLMEGEKVVKPNLQPSDLTGLTTQYTNRAVNFIDRNKDKPFFLYLAHNLPHVPLFASDKFRGKTKRGLYGDVIEEIDWSVGEVQKALVRDKIDKNTLVIFTSDNGPWLSYGDHAGSAGPLREGKGTNWEGGTRVPCIMRWPGRIPAGTSTNEMAMTIDLWPTLAHLTGATLPPHPIDGLDIWPLISGQKGAKNPHQAYFYYYENNQLQAVTSGDGRWKMELPHGYNTLKGRPGGKGGIPARYERRTIQQTALYNLQNDVGETTDVSAQNPEVVSLLQRAVVEARADLGDSLTNQQGQGVRPLGRLVSSSPQIVGKTLDISCDVTGETTEGVILAQGGLAHGYAIYLKSGKLIFSVRQKGRLTSIQAPSLQGRVALRARLEKDGAMSLAIDGKVVSIGKAPGLFTVQPGEDLSIGKDTLAAVGDYTAPFPFEGRVENVKVLLE